MEACEAHFCLHIHLFLSVKCDLPLRAALQEFSDMGGMLCFVFVKYDYVIDHSAVALEASKRFIHSPVVVLGDGRYPEWCTKEFKPPKGGDEGGQFLAFPIQWALTFSAAMSATA